MSIQHWYWDAINNIVYHAVPGKRPLILGSMAGNITLIDASQLQYAMVGDLKTLLPYIRQIATTFDIFYVTEPSIDFSKIPIMQPIKVYSFVGRTLYNIKRLWNELG